MEVEHTGTITRIDWDAMNLRPFDDGHRPETVTVACQISEYPIFKRQQNPQVHVYANALPEQIVDAAYEKSAGNPKPAWGDYVTVEQVKDYWSKNGTGTGTVTGNCNCTEPLTSDNLVVALAAHYLQISIGEGTQAHPSAHFDLAGNSTPSPLWNRVALEELAHGVAVWGLAAETNSEVPYHLDYAEQIRYETNVVVPPLVAGTIQCTRDKIKGGDFLISLEGIPHYEKHGYKCKRSIPAKEDMICIPYRFNQLSCHLGNLPHASTKIEHIEGTQKRVIIGFNVFGHDIGKVVQEAPEHSHRFRQKIQAQRAILRSNQKVLSFERLKQNKPLSKLLVLAKRERIKQQYQEAQRRLATEIPKYLPATVQQLMDRFYSPENKDDLCWPASPTDVQVYIHHQIRHGRFSPIQSNHVDHNSLSDGLISPQVTIGMHKSVQ
jgi:hypothetical protein